MAAHDSAPHALEVFAADFVLGSVDVRDALSVVEDCSLAVIAAINLEQRLTFVLVALSALEASEASLLVESVTLR